MGGRGDSDAGQVDFFISHAGTDHAWAEWVAVQLRDAGYSVELDIWHWAAGQNFITKISDTLGRADRVIALWSAEYFSASRYTTHEWSAVLADGREDRLVPLRIEDVPAPRVPPILRPMVYRDLFGVDENEARRVLLEAIAAPGRQGRQAGYPGQAAAALRGGAGGAGGSVRLPGTLPRVWNVPARNLGFVGRDALLAMLGERLLSGDRAVVQALRGMGGVGKTQLAIEYAHQFAGGYDLAWWIAAEQPGLILDQIAALAVTLGCAEPDAPADAAAQAAIGALRTAGRWLLVFDNAESPGDLAQWLPGGSTGHVLITTRTGGWSEIAAAPVEVSVFARAESAEVLRARINGLPEDEADRLAADLGDLPLAIAQAASYLADSGMPAEEYRDLVRHRAAHVLDQGPVMSYPTSLAGATRLTMERLAREDPGAAGLAELCAFLAPEPIPLSLFTVAAGQLPQPLGPATTDALAWRRLLATLGRSSLARVDQQAMQMHRLTQAILRDRLGPGPAGQARALAGKLLAASNPGPPSDPVGWPRWALLVPHVLAIDPAASDDPEVRVLACNTAWYLLMRGDLRSGRDLAQHLYRHWKQRLGSDDPHTLWAANSLATAHQQMGQYAEARRLDEDILDRRRRLLGDDDIAALSSASNLAVDLHLLGEHAAARKLFESTLAGRRRVLGEDHRETMDSASNLANHLREVGDHQAARELDESTLASRRRILGDDHPDTLASASSLAADLHALGDHQAARELDESTLASRRRILGDDHPDTLASASSLAADLHALGDHQAARELDESTLASRRRILGDDHPDTLASAVRLAASHQAARQPGQEPRADGNRRATASGGT